jgi:hypothetical protein
MMRRNSRRRAFLIGMLSVFDYTGRLGLRLRDNSWTQRDPHEIALACRIEAMEYMRQSMRETLERHGLYDHALVR